MLCTRIISIYTQKASQSIYTVLQHTSVWVVLPDVTQKNRNEPQAPAEGALSLNLGCVGTSCPATIPLLISWSFSIKKREAEPFAWSQGFLSSTSEGNKALANRVLKCLRGCEGRWPLPLCGRSLSEQEMNHLCLLSKRDSEWIWQAKPGSIRSPPPTHTHSSAALFTKLFISGGKTCTPARCWLLLARSKLPAWFTSRHTNKLHISTWYKNRFKATLKILPHATAVGLKRSEL